MPFFSTPGKFEQLPTQTNQQQGISNQVGQQALKMLQGLGQNQFDFAPIAQQARNNFNTKTVPTIAERFTALGGGNTRFGNQLPEIASAGANLDSSLAALQSQFGLQQQGQQNQLLQSLLGLSLQPQQQQIYKPGEQGIFEQLLGPGLQALLAYLPGLSSLSGLGGNRNQQQSQGMGMGSMMGSQMFPQSQGFGAPALWNNSFSQPLGQQLGQLGVSSLGGF